MLYDDRQSAYTINEQKRLQSEYDKEGLREWIEKREGQPDAVVHGRYMYSYGIVKTTCAECGSEFYCRTESYHTGRKYCSNRCANDAYIYKRNTQRVAARNKICPICGKQFQAKRRDSIFCSSACKQSKYRQSKQTSMTNQ